MVGFTFEFPEPVCTCVRCGREREMPEPGGGPRFPSRDGESLTLQADTPCEQCKSLRVRVTFEFDDEQDEDE